MTTPERDELPEWFDEVFDDWLQDFQEETDRACAILATTLLDVLLGELLTVGFHGGKTATKKFFEGLGPLASFSARIEAAYGFGFISKMERDDLNVLRTIRNDFAHSVRPMTLADDDVVARVRSLRMPPELGFPLEVFQKMARPDRIHFVTGVVFAANALKARLQRAEKPTPPVGTAVLFEEVWPR